ncbi:MAG: hypothetical protein ACKOXK_06895 [Chakrabartia sp.]
MKRILPLWLGVFAALCTFLWYAVHCRAAAYQDLFWDANTNAARCQIAQDGARFMRRFAMFDDADQLESLGESSCLADFHGRSVLMPRHRPPGSLAWRM